MKTKKVKVEKTVFNSLKEAAGFLACHPSYISQVLARGANQIKGRNIEILENASSIGNTKKTKKRACPVLCETSGKMYPTIMAAAKAAKAHPWTMSLKMETTGKFIDKDGNTYVRTKPMASKEGITYSNKYSEMIRHVRPYIKKKVDISNNIENKTESFSYSALEKTAIDFISKKHYKEASAICTVLNDLMKGNINA